ncbi:N-acetylglucosamine-6-phosphate deacetylase [uncultured Clostridium sp.]|uniref:N-acetylglucosamine-6-phosphate deacetylase n=1 Tax=uncultured Clostridium sp. TaxID=59620 RepID=UPI002582D013|nr:N-acetylglucosamine-6-phosphate deacetylase [uncultured Clostridium sp.]MDU1350826.1 N-acetylglucosamine-6-phosphate deacetylase [Clostridium argentinense]
MAVKCIKNGNIILKDKVIQGKAIIYDKKTIDIVEDKYVSKDIETIDIEGNYISPGFIDIHVHGSKGFDVMDGNIKAIENISKSLCAHGVTGFLPTTMTMSIEDIHKALKAIKDFMHMKFDGSKVLGVHLEGPFISPIYKGAQNEKYILSPTIEIIKPYIDIIKIITIAPEMDENHIFIKSMNKNKNMLLSIGHTNSTYEQAMSAIEDGIKSATHCFNAMTPLHHRNPGVVGAILNSDIYCEFIADTIHVHPALYTILEKIKGEDRIILISDAMRAACMKSGNYDLGGQRVFVSNERATLEDGTLAGSLLTLDKAVKNMKVHSRLDIEKIIKMVTINPASAIGIDDMSGTIEIGKHADFTVFNENIDILYTIVEGNLCFRKEF